MREQMRDELKRVVPALNKFVNPVDMSIGDLEFYNHFMDSGL